MEAQLSINHHRCHRLFMNQLAFPIVYCPCTGLTHALGRFGISTFIVLHWVWFVHPCNVLIFFPTRLLVLL
ncbi:hypothetical protein CIPAW_16G112400 [Carya illinoinensis]|uniref:Uncharacterized protein n=1 Tax=Carya illinoinensis TaxID=32201 RepID=A0A8T1N300_CARIL|nr:hypothetical protein CIPAW_16G112400 [Carya illinoinensis]